MHDPSDDPHPLITELDFEFAEAKLDAALRWMAPLMTRLLPVSFWFPERATAHIVVARVQFYPALMAHAPFPGDADEPAIPLFLASSDPDWDPFDHDARRADNVFDRAAGMK